jgi:hypothetical protein
MSNLVSDERVLKQEKTRNNEKTLDQKRERKASSKEGNKSVNVILSTNGSSVLAIVKRAKVEVLLIPSIWKLMYLKCRRSESS